ncbi:MAG: FAD-binding oxidoreductase, partial [Desulfomonilia bacterium]|nr:FAD-binding oxidoreductase [Desulfomonilia bacterium]
MAFKDVMKDIEGFQEIQHEVEILRKYGHGFASRRGEVKHMIDMLHPARVTLEVSAILDETPSTRTLRFVSPEGYLPPFQAGQYVNLFVEVGGVRTSRPYSISSSPTQAGYYDLTLRRTQDGFVSNYLLDEVTVGDTFESSSPAGTFTYNPLFHGTDLVFLAGGSGITPFMSMIREVADRGLKRNIQLVYGSQSPDDVIFGRELEEIARTHGNISFDVVISEPPAGYTGCTGFLSASCIRDCIGEIGNKMFYLCGPEAMYTFCEAELEGLGIKKRRIRKEVFGPPKDVTLQPGWPQGLRADAEFSVTLEGGGHITARAGEPLMNSLERQGIVIPALCRSGECSLCRTRLVSGRVYQPQGVKLRKSDRQFGYIHPCMAY